MGKYTMPRCLSWRGFHSFCHRSTTSLTWVILQAHTQLHHSGVNATLTLLCQCYWIPSGRQRVRSLISKCVICKRVAGKPYAAPDPPPLVKDQVNATHPFEVTGVDSTGAMYICSGTGEHKVYICLFTCAVSRAYI